ncbi:AraC-like DNA-binding protein [Paenibacillus phyllosphaerae]|uniref:AraC-like DNA-binding protein n=1 Tax=Paenibacillus phyllosphaerae TaxID=274593 RepID=A0A7W5AVE5_9BACL|nr:AraC family transcriptional regulator [Paenibacillus phyllosphaerae]MBB3108991.1 AraC-like DNA-binding protein [Paenibacillus phyllosphaerae]
MNKATLKEARIHGNARYPISIYPIVCPPDEPLLDLHWHDEMELLLVTAGQAVFRVDATDYEVAAGEAIFVASGDLHSGSVLGSEPCSFIAVVFHPELLGSGAIDLTLEHYIQPIVQKKRIAPVHLTHAVPHAAELLTLLETLIELNVQKPPVYELTTRGMLLLIMAKLYMLTEGPAPAQRQRSTDDYRIERLKSVLHYMHEHFSEPIKLSQLAGLVSMSEAYFCRFFKEITAKSPMEYLNQYRMQQAAILLRETDKKMMEVALDVGFNNLSYFIEVFKEHYGNTPAAYRRKGPVD